jgi:hypothetical protein
VFDLRGQYAGIMGCITRLEARRNTLVILLDFAKREVTLHKGVEEGVWTAEEMAVFSLKVYVNNFSIARNPHRVILST